MHKCSCISNLLSLQLVLNQTKCTRVFHRIVQQNQMQKCSYINCDVYLVNFVQILCAEGLTIPISGAGTLACLKLEMQEQRSCAIMLILSTVYTGRAYLSPMQNQCIQRQGLLVANVKPVYIEVGPTCRHVEPVYIEVGLTCCQRRTNVYRGRAYRGPVCDQRRTRQRYT